MSEEKSTSFDMQDCLSILSFVSTIPEGHKPCYKTKTTMSKDGWFVTFKRRWNGEKGEYGIEYINKVLDSCDLHYRMCLRNSGGTDNMESFTETMRTLSTSLKGSVNGFENLINTYCDQQGVAVDYKKCKKIVIDLYKDIDRWLENINKTRLYYNRNKKDSIPNNRIIEGCDDYYYPEEDVYYWEFMGTKKKPMMVSLLVSKDSGKPGFFNTNNVMFIAPKK